MNYGENIYRLRKEADISQEALAAAIGTTRQQVSRWECGSALPSAKYVYALADYFQCPIQKILGEEIPEEEKQRGHISELPEQFAHFCRLLVLISLIFFFVSALLKSFSERFLETFYLSFGQIELEAEERTAINVTGAEMAQMICVYGAIAETLIAGGFFLGLLFRLLHDKKRIHSRIDAYQMFVSFYHACIFLFACIIASWLMMVVGNHVGFFPIPYFDSLFYLLGGILLSLVICLGFFLILRIPLGKRWMLLPEWTKEQKAMDIVLLAVGGSISIIYIVLSAPSYVAFLLFGYLYFLFAAALLLLYFLIRYKPFGKSE
ncbi:MAG: helix-turn-helix transcriptional regulator [Bacilli bacterium]|nr:helix-turn-helix transcriptional regulator [Bacilli bacterium]